MGPIITDGDCNVNTFGVRPLSRNVNNGGMDFPARLRQLRIAANLSQEALAEAMGWSGQSQVSNYEKGRGDPKFSELPMLAKALGVGVPELFVDAAVTTARPSHLGGIDPTMLAESIAALRKVARNQGWVYDPETHPAETVYAYELRSAMPAKPPMADLIDFGAKVADRLRRIAEGADGGQRHGGQAGGTDRKRS